MHKIQCTIYQVENDTKQKPMTDEEIREWQANRLGAALIMPAQTVKISLADKLGLTAVDALSPEYYSDTLIREIAAEYNVSNAAMRIRLENLNLLLS